MIETLLTRGLAAWDRMKVIPYWTGKECYGHGWRCGYRAATRDTKKGVIADLQEALIAVRPMLDRGNYISGVSIVDAALGSVPQRSGESK